MTGAALATLALAASGGAIAAFLGLPVSWLLGAVVAVFLAVMAGLRARVPNPLRDAAFLALGVQAGSAVTPEVLEQIALWPLSFLIQMIGVLGVIGATFLFLHHVFRWDRQTALFASIPGALSFVLAAASETRADITRVVIVQSLRLLLLIGFLVPMLALLEEGDAASPYRVVENMPEGAEMVWQYALLASASLLGAWLGVKSRLPGGLILGALVASTVLHGTEIAVVPLPPLLATLGLIVIGALIGSRLHPDNRGALVALLAPSLGAFAIGLVMSALAGLAAIFMLGLEVGKVALAYAPGALEALIVLAYQFDQDPAYVAAHHVVRFVALAITVPLFAKRIARRTREAETVAARDTGERL